jgi:16S rRNA A1518/A1519 N6-dimethyltransferase RsmA/KsgA/DIM1 with predicted DNA glycosylase/AP lyase activity
MNKIYFKRTWEKLLAIYNKKSAKIEDRLVIDFLSKNNSNGKSYIEIGAGFGHFVKTVEKRFDFNVSVVEINKNLVNRTEWGG